MKSKTFFCCAQQKKVLLFTLFLGREVNFLLKKASPKHISIKWDKPLGQTTGWLRAKQYFEPQTLACVVLACTKWRSGVGIDDGTGLPAKLPKSD